MFATIAGYPICIRHFKHGKIHISYAFTASLPFKTSEFKHFQKFFVFLITYVARHTRLIGIGDPHIVCSGTLVMRLWKCAEFSQARIFRFESLVTACASIDR